MTQNTI